MTQQYNWLSGIVFVNFSKIQSNIFNDLEKFVHNTTRSTKTIPNIFISYTINGAGDKIRATEDKVWKMGAEAAAKVWLQPVDRKLNFSHQFRYYWAISCDTELPFFDTFNLCEIVFACILPNKPTKNWKVSKSTILFNEKSIMDICTQTVFPYMIVFSIE